MASPQEVLRGRAVNDRRLLGHHFPVFIEALKPEWEPAHPGFEEANPKLRKAVKDPADGKIEHRLHGTHRMRHCVYSQPSVEAIDDERRLARRLPTTVGAHCDPQTLGSFPNHIEAFVVEVLVANMRRGHHPDEPVLGDAAFKFFGGQLGFDHRELCNELDAIGRVARVFRSRVVHGGAECRGEIAIVHRPFFSRTRREQDGYVDPFEIHVDEAFLRVKHPRLHGRPEFEVVLCRHHV